MTLKGPANGRIVLNVKHLAPALLLLAGCGSSERIERLEARVAELERELGRGADAERPRSTPLETVLSKDPARLLTAAEARRDERTMSPAALAALSDFKLLEPTLDVSRNAISFSAVLRGPAERHLKDRKGAGFMRVVVPLSPEQLAKEGAYPALVRDPEASDAVLKPNREEMRRGRKVNVGDYLDVLSEKRVLLAFVDGKGLLNSGRRLFALVQPVEPGLEWIQCELPAPYAQGTEAYASLAKGLEAWRFDDQGWTEETEDAVLACLVWLARHQDVDGLWSPSRHVERCVEPRACPDGSGAESVRVGVSALCLLAFLGAGYSPDSREMYRGISFGNVLRSGLRALVELQSPAGAFDGDPSRPRAILNHALAAFAMTEAYGLTGHQPWADSARLAVRSLVASQNRDGGWGDAPGRSDGFVTGMTLLVFHSARVARMNVPEDVVRRATAYLASLRDAKGRIGYQSPGSQGAHVPGVNSAQEAHPILSQFPAILSPEERDRLDARVLERSALTETFVSSWRVTDYLYLWLATAAKYRLDGPWGPLWKSWSEPLRHVLVKSQKSSTDGCEDGSWAPRDAWSRAGSRVYATAVNALTLEIYYRYANTPWFK